MPEMKIAVMGAAGRMGRELVRAIAADPACTLSGGVEAPSCPDLGRDLGELAGLGANGVRVTADALELIARSDAIIDFTSPKATVDMAGLAANARIVHVIGTTGLDAVMDAAIAAAARHATIIKSGNMSLGVNLTAALTERVGSHSRCRLGHRNHRDASQAQGRCAFRHSPDARQSRRERPRGRSDDGIRARA